MSSHHFVIDGQEPALIIADGQRCEQKLLDQLLEWCPFVVVLDGALQDVLDKGIAFNVVSGDFDSEPDAKGKTAHIQHVEVIHTPDQDFTDLEKGIQICKNRGYKDVHVVWGTGKRMDHSIGNLDLIAQFQGEVNVIFWDDYQKIYLAPSGFRKWYPKDTPLSLIPWPKCAGIQADNLKWPLHDLELTIGQRLGTCNKILNEGILEITYQTGTLILFEQLSQS
jgi:thiamine pyrophosphokinase